MKNIINYCYHNFGYSIAIASGLILGAICFFYEHDPLYACVIVVFAWSGTLSLINSINPWEY